MLLLEGAPAPGGKADTTPAPAAEPETTAAAPETAPAAPAAEPETTAAAPETTPAANARDPTRSVQIARAWKHLESQPEAAKKLKQAN